MKLLVIEVCEKSTYIYIYIYILIYNVDIIKNQTNLGQTLKVLGRAN